MAGNWTTLKHSSNIPPKSIRVLCRSDLNAIKMHRQWLNWNIDFATDDHNLQLPFESVRYFGASRLFSLAGKSSIAMKYSRIYAGEWLGIVFRDHCRMNKNISWRLLFDVLGCCARRFCIESLQFCQGMNGHFGYFNSLPIRGSLEFGAVLYSCLCLLFHLVPFTLNRWLEALKSFWWWREILRYTYQMTWDM